MCLAWLIDGIYKQSIHNPLDTSQSATKTWTTTTQSAVYTLPLLTVGQVKAGNMACAGCMLAGFQHLIPFLQWPTHNNCCRSDAYDFWKCPKGKRLRHDLMVTSHHAIASLYDMAGKRHPMTMPCQFASTSVRKSLYETLAMMKMHMRIPCNCRAHCRFHVPYVSPGVAKLPQSCY